MENVYSKFEREITLFAYNFAKEVEQEINSCELDREHGAQRAAVINSCLDDLQGSLSGWPYARAIIKAAKDKAKEKFEHLEEIYKN